MTNDPGFQRPALDVLAELRRGKAKHDMTTRLHEAVRAVQNTGKKAEVVIKLTIEPLKNDKTQVEVTDVITSKLPTLALPSSRFYLTDDGNLTRDDPEAVKYGIQAVIDDAGDEQPAGEKKAN